MPESWQAETMSGLHDPLEITPTLLLRAYAAGVFPMADSAASDEIFWVDPRQRGVIPLDGLHVSRTMRKIMRRGDFVVRINSGFRQTLQACAAREETWINDEILELYLTLHRLGYAHSVEVWAGGKIVGGLYGVCLGGAFFGESMFSIAPNASKLALIWLVARLRAGGFTLLDTQFLTEHLASLGAVEISRSAYHSRLDAALAVKADFGALPDDLPADQVLQLITQTS